MKILGSLKGFILIALSPVWRQVLLLRGVSVGSGFTCVGRPGLNRTSGSSVTLGKKVTLCSSGMANPLAEHGRCRMATVAKGAEIVVGDEVGMSSVLICSATSVVIGKGTQIGGGTMIIDTDFHLRVADETWGTDPKAVSRPITIGKHCFIGARAIILKGVTIGDHCVGNPATRVGNTAP